MALKSPLLMPDQPLRLPTSAPQLTGYDANDCRLLIGIGPSAVIERQR